jgi:hypothetical protein
MEVVYMDLRKFDKRIVDRNIDKGIVAPKEYQKYLSELKNLEDELEVFEVQPPDQKISRVEDAPEKGEADNVVGNGLDKDNEDI